MDVFGASATDAECPAERKANAEEIGSSPREGKKKIPQIITALEGHK